MLGVRGLGFSRFGVTGGVFVVRVFSRFGVSRLQDSGSVFRGSWVRFGVLRFRVRGFEVSGSGF